MNDYLNSLIGGTSSANANFGSSLSKFANGINSYKPTIAPVDRYTPTPSSPSAVSPTSPTTTNPAIKTPAAQSFINNLTPAQQASNSAMTSSGNYTFANGTGLGKNAPLSTTSAGTTGTSTSSSNPVSLDATTAYSQYLASKITADQKLADIQSQEDAQNQGAREQQDTILHTPGGLLSGATQASSVAGRNAANVAADLAVQEGAAARSAGVADTAYTNATSANKPISVGDQLYQLQSDGTYKSIAGSPKLDTSTVDVNGNREIINNQTGDLIKNLGSSTATADTSSTYVAGTNPSVDAWVSNINSGKAKLSDITGNPTLKSLVSQGLSQSGGSTTDILNTTVQSLGELNDLVNSNTGFTGAVGAKGISSLFGLKGTPIAGTDAANFDAKLNQVKNDVILPNLTLLHGLGRVTDREFQALTSAVTSLSTNLSEDAFKTELANITKSINDKVNESGQGDANLSVTDPNGGVHTFKTATDATAFKTAITPK